MAQDQLVLLSRSQQPLYAQNPLFQPEPADARATVAGVGGYGNDVGGDGVGWGRRHEEVLAPFLDSLRSTSTDPMYSAFSAQMNNLYQVFKDLYDQDQGEIRQLLSALESQKQQLQQLAAENNGVRQQLAREREQAVAVVASAGAAAAAAQAQAQAQGRAAAKARTPQAEAGTQTEAAAGDGTRLEAPGAASMARSRTRQRVGQSGPAGGDSPARAPSPVRSPGSPQGWSPTSRGGYGRYGSTGSLSPDGKARPAYVLFLPYMLHPAHHCWRFYAAWMYSWTTRRTLWLAVAWVFVFLLAVGLLVGLLVPWGELSSTEFSTPPAVANVSSTELSVTLQLNRNAMVYYAVVPEEATTHAAPPARRRLLMHGHDPGGGGGGGREGGGLTMAVGAWAEPWALPRRALLATAPGAARLSRLVQEDVGTDDIRYMAETGRSDGNLFPYAVACGAAEVSRTDPPHNYTLSVASAADSQECAGSFGLLRNGTSPLSEGPFRERRCLRCPWLRPATRYVLFLFGDGGRNTDIVRLNFTTAAA